MSSFFKISKSIPSQEMDDESFCMIEEEVIDIALDYYKEKVANGNEKISSTKEFLVDDVVNLIAYIKYLRDELATCVRKDDE